MDEEQPTRDEQIATVIGYVGTLNSAIDVEPESGAEGESLLNFVVETVFDRVLLYLNYPADIDTLPVRLLRLVAQVVVSAYNQAAANQSSTGVEQSISSVSDNGQSVGYRNEVKNYFATADDGALFGGFAGLLSRYRRVNVGS